MSVKIYKVQHRRAAYGWTCGLEVTAIALPFGFKVVM